MTVDLAGKKWETREKNRWETRWGKSAFVCISYKKRIIIIINQFVSEF